MDSIFRPLKWLKRTKMIKLRMVKNKVEKIADSLYVSRAEIDVKYTNLDETYSEKCRSNDL